MGTIDEPRGRREEYSEATREALLAAGLEAFARDGYQGTALEVVSRSARVTRGALYHHFKDKKALFDAVVVVLQDRATARIEASTKAMDSVWERLMAGIDAYLDVCIEPVYARVVVQEAQAVLGNARYREIEEPRTFALLVTTLNALKRRKEISADDVVLLSRMVDAMICELAVLLPSAEDPSGLRIRGQKIIAGLLESVRIRSLE